MTDGPPVSAIVPVHDRADLLPRTLATVRGQRYRPLEVVVVDDASAVPLSAAALRDAAGDVPVRVLRHDANRGPAAARATGLAAAGGTYVAFLDSDDLWHPDKVSRQVAALEGAQGPALAIARTHAVRAGRVEPRPVWRPERGSLARYLFAEAGTMQTSSILLPRGLARAIGFDPALRRYEDWLFLLRAAARGCAFLYQEERLVDWHRGARDDQLSRTVHWPSAKTFAAALPGLATPAEIRAFEVAILGPALARRAPARFARSALRALAEGSVRPHAVLGALRRAPAVRFAER